MKKSYIFSLIMLILVLILILAAGFGYYLFCLNHKKDIYSVANGCVETIYTSKSETLEMKAIPLSDDDGKSINPYSIAIKNICQKDIKVEFRLNLVNNPAVDKDAIKVFVNGDFSQKPILFSSLNNSSSSSQETNSKIIGSITIKGKQTVRANIRMWLDEKLGSSSSNQNLITAKVELSSEQSTIKPSFDQVILTDNGGVNNIKSKEAPNFNQSITTNDGLFSQATDSGDSFYFRGKADNNYVSFADMTWRIIGINADNSIKLIQETNTYSSSVFNSNQNTKDFVGYTYVNGEKVTDSVIKTYLSNWYVQNIKDKGYGKYLVEQDFCNDSSSIIERTSTEFGGYQRLYDDKTPISNCPKTTETFGGNYTEIIGLITADEVALAGGLEKQANNQYYLYTGSSYFTMTPSDYSQSIAYMMIVSNRGEINDAPVSKALAIRPVINLKSGLTVAGTGTVTDPYIINLDTE